MYGFPHRTFQEYLAGRRMAWGDSAERAEMLLARAAEGDYWSLAADYCAESLFYLATTRDSSLLELLRELCPNDPPETEAQWRTTLWAARMAVLAGRETVQDYAKRKNDKSLLPQRLLPRLCSILSENHLPVIERAEAGTLLAQLGDPRFDPHRFYLPTPPIPNLGFIEIPAGPFWMGTRKADIPKLIERLGGQADWYERETECHAVPADPFWMARWPTTLAQFRAFVAQSGYRPADPDCLRGIDNHPVVNVTWHDALAYCDWLTEQVKTLKVFETFRVSKLSRDHGWRVRLPSEREWEKAARGGFENREYPWGDDPDPKRANISRTGLRSTSSVGCFPSLDNSYGCEDMSGNVWEWTRSLWGEDSSEPTFKYPYIATDGRENLKAPNDVLRVLRGGSWYFTDYGARVARRDRDLPDLMLDSNGFRVVVGLAPSSAH